MDISKRISKYLRWLAGNRGRIVAALILLGLILCVQALVSGKKDQMTRGVVVAGFAIPFYLLRLDEQRVSFAGIRERWTLDRLLFALLLFAGVTYFMWWWDEMRAFGLVTIAGSVLALMGLAQQFELLQKQRELLMVNQTRVEETVAAVLTPLFEDLETYGLGRTVKFEAMLVTPAFGIFGGPAVFERFVDLVSSWLKKGDGRKLIFHVFEEEEHRELFGQRLAGDRRGKYAHRLFECDDAKDSVDRLGAQRNLVNLARLAALAESSADARSPFTVRFCVYKKLTDFRVLCASGEDHKVAAVMAFSRDWCDEKTQADAGIDTNRLESMTAFGTHPDTFSKAWRLIGGNTKVDQISVEWKASDFVRYFAMDDATATSFSSEVARQKGALRASQRVFWSVDQ